MMRRSIIRIFASVIVISLLAAIGCSASADVLFNDEHLRISGLREEGIKTVHAITFVGDTCFAYLDDESLRTYQDDGSLLRYCTLPEIALNPYVQPSASELQDIVTNIATDGQTLYGWNEYSGQFGTIDEDGIRWADKRLQTASLHPYGSIETFRIAGSFVSKDTLFAFVSLTEYQKKTEYRFVAFDLVSGRSQSYTIPNAVGVCPGADNQFLFLCLDENGWSIRILNIDTDEQFSYPADMSAFSADSVVCGLAYNKADDRILFACNGTVYAVLPEGKVQGIGSVNTDGCMSESAAWVLSSGRYALCSMIGLNIVNTGVAPVEKTRLVVQGNGLTKVNVLFQTAYPHTVLTCKSEGTSAFDLTTRLLTRDDSIDVYKIQADSTYTSIKGKGMLAPLSDSVLLKQELLAMPAAIAEAITDSRGTLVAYPASLTISTFGINKDYWQTVFGDQPIPTTMGELLDAWVLFEDYYADDYPLLDMWFGFDEKLLCSKFIYYYLQTHENPASTLAKDPSLRMVLEKLAQIADLRTKHQRTLTEWTPNDSEGHATILSLFADREAMYCSPTFYLETQENMLYGFSIFNYSPLTLTWEKNELPQTSATMTVYVVNPYTKHLQEALRYIECASKLEANPYLYYAIHPAMQEPYKNPSFSSKIAALSADIKDIEELLQRDDLEYTDRLDLEAMLDYKNRIIQEQEQLKWLIPSEAIAEDQALLKEINLNLNNVYLTAMTASDDVDQLCDQYVNDNLTLDMFLKNLSSTLSMIEMESR